MKILQYIFLLIFISQCQSARILAVLPIPSYSHQVTFQPYTQELVKRGHEVTVITPYPAFPKGKAPTHLTEIDIHEVGNEIRREFFSKMMKVSDLIEQQELSIISMGQAFEKFLSLGLFQEFVDSKVHKFDLVVVEASVRQALVFSHVFNAPIIQISSFGGNYGTFEAIGASTHPLVYPSAARQRFQDLTVWKKIMEYFSHYYLMWTYYSAEKYENHILKKYFGPNTPELSKLKQNIALILLNIHSIWDANRPVPPNVVYLGELNKHKPKDLPQEIKSYLDSSKNGVIYISFGTNVNRGILTPEKIQIMIKVFHNLPYDVLMKKDNTTVIGSSKNVKMFDWVPQMDVLRHPKVKLFITQGGLQSSHEAIEAGVPLIGIPMMWDQWLNVDKYVKFKIGLQLDILSLDEEKLKTAINTVLNTQSFKNNVEKLRTFINDQPQTPLEKAIWWTECVLKYGGDLLRTEAADLEWSEYYEIKIITSIIVAIIITVISGILLINKLR